MTKLDFCSILFLCFFFPIFFLLYYFVPKKYKNDILLLGSILFILIGRENLIWYFLLLTGFSYISFHILSNLPKIISKKKFLYFVILIECFIWFFCTFNFQSKNWIYPICYMVILLENIGSLIDFYHKKEKIPNMKLYFTYASCFPKLLIGPVLSYGQMEKELQSRTITTSKFSDGIFLFLNGLGIRILIVGFLSSFHQSLLVIHSSISSFFILLLITALEIALWFKSYSDMTSGLGKMLGFTWKKETSYPLASLSFREFLERCHLSIFLWWKRYAPFLKKKYPLWIKLLLFLFFLSITYGVNLSIFSFFFTIGIFILIEEKRNKILSNSISYIFHFLVLLFPFCFFIYEKLSFDLPLINQEFTYLLSSYFLILLIALGIAYKGFYNLSKWLESYFAFLWIRNFWYLSLLLVILIFLISGLQNISFPFLI